MNPICLIVVCFVVAATSVSANWRGPFDTHDEHSLWLRTQMKKTPQKDFILAENDLDGYNILDYGAVPETNTVDAAVKNGEAFFAATAAANISSSPTAKPRVVIIPSGMNFWMLPSTKPLWGLNNITFQFNGNLSASNVNLTAWPLLSNGKENDDSKKQFKVPLIYPQYSTDLVFVGNAVKGGGCIQGHGYPWWEEEYNKTSYNAARPNLLQFTQVHRLVIDSLSLFDSPRYHIDIDPAFGVLIQNLKIEVSIFDQYYLQKKYNKMLHEKVDFPTFPLNTDGIDMRGNTIVVRHSSVLNFDDSYCPKPLQEKSSEGCTHNILVQDCTQILGVGTSIGSVPPNLGINCVKNVTFDRITYKHCLKCIYVKPNPGNSGYGLIQDITYSNSHASLPLWWSIYVSTQQQDQPGGGSNTGCSFFYPLPGQKCPTQPRVPVRNLYLTNMTFDDALLSPGIMRCNDTYAGPGSGPCTGWNWNNVKMTSILKWPFGENFLCHAVEKPVFNNVYPSCIANVPTHAPPSSSSPSVASAELLASLFERTKNTREVESREGKMMLDDLGKMMEERGISLLNVMKQLKSRNLR